MISVITGQPGAGKTLHTLWLVKQLAEKEGRDVYYHGINDLKLPWIEIDDPTKWHELPVGAIIVLDECQRTFRNRANGSQVPEHVAKLETHRHNGHDLFLITQHPMIIDGNVRRLVGRHVHVMRRFGAQSAVLHEWNGVKENCDKTRKDSQSKKWVYPKEVFDYYKSAELHTHKRQLPKKLLILVLAPFLIAAAIWYMYQFAQKKIHPEGQKPDSTASQTASMPAGYHSQNGDGRTKPLTAAEWLALQTPRIDGLPQTAPAYDELTKPQQVPAPQACVVMGAKCKCFTNQATPINTPDDMCRQIVNNGIFLPHLPPAGAVTQDQQLLKQQYEQQQGEG